jgi:hypothetical protein
MPTGACVNHRFCICVRDTVVLRSIAIVSAVKRAGADHQRVARRSRELACLIMTRRVIGEESLLDEPLRPQQYAAEAE